MFQQTVGCFSPSFSSSTRFSNLARNVSTSIQGPLEVILYLPFGLGRWELLACKGELWVAELSAAFLSVLSQVQPSREVSEHLPSQRGCRQSSASHQDALSCSSCCRNTHGQVFLCCPPCAGPITPYTCPSQFLMPSVCVFRESLGHLVTKVGKDPSDHPVTR